MSEIRVAGTDGEVCVAMADGFLDERTRLVPLPIARIEMRE